jgi:hypothetical protein
MTGGTVRQKIIILIWKEQFHFWEYINGNQTFILDSHHANTAAVVGKTFEKVYQLRQAQQL